MGRKTDFLGLGACEGGPYEIPLIAVIEMDERDRHGEPQLSRLHGSN